MALKRKAYTEDDRKAETESRRKWKAQNPGKDTSTAAARRSRIRDYIREYGRAYARIRQKHQLTATPKWADRGAIAAFYADCQPGFQVDHIVPLRGRIVSGLHVLNNLQYLPASENQKKNNLFEGEET